MLFSWNIKTYYKHVMNGYFISKTSYSYWLISLRLLQDSCRKFSGISWKSKKKGVYTELPCKSDVSQLHMRDST